jgi:hypothetical protein
MCDHHFWLKTNEKRQSICKLYGIKWFTRKILGSQLIPRGKTDGRLKTLNKVYNDRVRGKGVIFVSDNGT